MKVAKVYGHIMSFIRTEKEFILKLETHCDKEIDGNLEKSCRQIEMTFTTGEPTMSPVGGYAETCMSLLDEFDDISILMEKSDSIREAYLIGKIMDSIAFDMFSRTKFTRLYEGAPELTVKSLN